MNRKEFQLKYFAVAPHNAETPQVLNVGSCDDPINFGEYAMHVDIDDWSAVHKHFKQADATNLPFADRSYHTVIMGDLLEHVVHPMEVILEGARVCSHTLVVTIFEEWRLPGHGQWIEIGQELGDKESRRLGYLNREDYQVKVLPKRIGVDDTVTPHLIHINQFDEADVEGFIKAVFEKGYMPLETIKAFECKHEDHDIYNWQLAFGRIGGGGDQ